MTDALCGPSNPLQHLQKHTSVDRTLQQDRLVGPRHSPVQDFRSQSQNAGILDPEFNAFQAGAPIAAEPPQFHHPQQGPARQFDPSVQGGPSNWAVDFQRLNLSNSASPLPQQKSAYQPPAQRSGPGGWHQEFMQHEVHPQPVSSPLAHQAYQPYMGHGVGNFQSQFAPRAGQPQQQQPAQADKGKEIWDDEAFEQAFDSARLAMLGQEEQGQSRTKETLEQLTEPTEITVQPTNLDHISEQARIGADTIDHQESNNRTEEEITRDENDELARVAGDLLDKVKDDQSQKFQQSNFLALMRRFRDHEVRVEGDRVVNNESSPERNNSRMTGAVDSEGTGMGQSHGFA
ncbi:hypothetical protein L228DRAFT_242823 [Xylona heveae TC161]|uniref:Peroxin 20 n=1 Tax=Xylona heveae (strain CBS 132557 / TC161) TaxID=1328760 RepID=A0A165JKV6_XYLHT|nr:hypothetical protein L228DRAFT_242823 [Xylona heveae TC161]KZF26362.1 hypothetical protein L228DRAFT_242823 [Xylona heveae TC161]